MLVVLVSSAIFGCVARESAFRVRGKIQAVSSSEACVMKVYRADTGALIDERTVNREFQETVVAAPGKHPYYLTISCGSPSLTYKSPTYELGTAEQFQRPVDLGTISLNNGAR